VNDYTFTEAELQALALLLRRNEEGLNPVLESFFHFVEGRIYDSMTIEEAERFFG